MLKEEIKFKNSLVFEGMTSIRAIIRAYQNGDNNRKLLKILYDKDKYIKNAKNIGYLRAVSTEMGFEVLESDSSTIEEMTLGTSHGGIIAIASERTFSKLDSSTDIKKDGFYCMIEGVEDPYNFGYAMRSLYACGADGIILSERNWMSAAGVVARSSAGASELFPIYVSDPIYAVDYFKKLGYNTVCADERTDNVLGKCEMKHPVFLVVGGEKRGISRALLDKIDTRVRIDYQRNFGASLSTASAATMFAYEISRQNSK